MSRSTRPPDHRQRMARLQIALDGLSVGDALGEQFFSPDTYFTHFRPRTTPPGPWMFTDDTEMALAIAEVLHEHGEILQDELAAVFAGRYERDPYRGYGGGAHGILLAIVRGESWQTASRSAFYGQGSFGNGGAMRIAPLGGYFADDFDKAAQQAALAAEVTHAHPEGQAGAVAVAVAAACAWGIGQQSEKPPPILIMETALQYVPAGLTRDGIEKALTFSLDEVPDEVAGVVGNGSKVSAQDTVPFALWCAARHLHDYAAAIWSTISVGGDIDTNCAIVGGIVSLAVGREGIPRDWLLDRETLPWLFPKFS